MARYLVVAHQTVTNPALLKQCLAVRQEDPQAEFVLLVPATPVHHLLFRRGVEGEAATVANKLAGRARAMFAKKGVPLSDARVGAESPADAIDDEVKADPEYAGFIISTLPRETSRWLRMDLPRTVESKYHKPVYHVLAEREWTAGDLP
jgi:hypothetical protein